MRRAGPWAGLLLSLLASFCPAQQIVGDRQAPSDETPSTGKWHGSGSQGAVAAGGEEAVAAGLGVLRSGGNAADAAVATILALAVTDSTMFCLGGEFTLLIYDAAHDRVEVVMGQGAAPRLATRELFANSGGIPGSGLRRRLCPRRSMPAWSCYSATGL